jgi:hypothetical protein
MLHSTESKFASLYSRISPRNRNDMEKYFMVLIRGLGARVENLAILSFKGTFLRRKVARLSPIISTIQYRARNHVAVLLETLQHMHFCVAA